jgi:predicted nuclease with TOPRIM domain
MPVSQIAEKLMKRAKELEDEVDVLSSGFERLRSVRARAVELLGEMESHVQRIRKFWENGDDALCGVKINPIQM